MFGQDILAVAGTVHPAVDRLISDVVERFPVIHDGDSLCIGVRCVQAVPQIKVLGDSQIGIMSYDPDTGIAGSIAPSARAQSTGIIVLEEIPAHHVPAVPTGDIGKERVVGKRGEAVLLSLDIDKFVDPYLQRGRVDIRRSRGAADVGT